MCSNGCSPKSNFSNLNGTWSKRSDLLMNDYDPYSELKGTNCYSNSRENYACTQGGPCAQYPTQNVGYSQTNPGGTAARYQVKFTEGFCCNTDPHGYNVLDKTWSQQKRYDL